MELARRADPSSFFHSPSSYFSPASSASPSPLRAARSPWLFSRRQALIFGNGNPRVGSSTHQVKPVRLVPYPVAVTLGRVIIGLLSDTHDRVDAMAAGVALLRARGAEFFIHCGDVGSERVLDYLAGLPSAFVFGNTDWDRATLARYARKIGVACHGAQADLALGGKKIAVTHGDDFSLKHRILSEQKHDYLFQGHTHVCADETVGKTRVINPGALHRVKEKTVAALDTESGKIVFLAVGG